MNCKLSGPGPKLLRLVLVCAVIGALAWSLLSAGVSFTAGGFLGVLAAQPVAWASIGLMAWRTRVITRGEVGIVPGLKGTAAAMVGAYLIPSRAADAVKAVYLRVAIGLPLSSGLALVLVERLGDVICLLLMLAASIWLGSHVVPLISGALVPLAVLLVAGTAGLVFVCLFPSQLVALVRFMPSARLRRFAGDGIAALGGIGSLPSLAGGLALSLLVWIASYLIFFSYFAVALGPALGPVDVLVIFVVATLGLSVAVLPAGIGTFECAMVLALTPYGYDLASALAVSVMIRLATAISPVAITAWIILRDHLDTGVLVGRQTPGGSSRA